MTLENKHFTDVEIKDSDRGEIRAIIARTGVVDRDGDWTLPGAIPDGSKVKLSAYGHSVVMDGARPVGRGVIVTHGEEVTVDAKYFMSTIDGRETFLTIKEMGPDQEWSYGYEILERGELTAELKAKGARRVLAKLRPVEVSPVLAGAGIETGTVLVKALRDGHPATDFAYVPNPEDAETWKLPLYDADQVRASLAAYQADVPQADWPAISQRLIAAAQEFGIAAEMVAKARAEAEVKASAARAASEQRAKEQRILEESRARFARTRARLGW